MPNFKGKNAADCFSVVVGDPTDNAKVVPGYAIVTDDHRTVVFNPHGNSATDNLGSASEDVSYIVHLSSGITREGGSQSVFTVANSDYKWRFTTNTIIDNTPPQVSSTVPADLAGISGSVNDGTLDAAGKVYLNQIVIVNFNEPIIPLVKQTQACNAGDNTNEAQILNNTKVKYKDGNGAEQECVTYHIPGDWKVGMNNYQTIQFISNAKCAGVERNSCGEPVFCLPSNSIVSGKLNAAEVDNGITLLGTGITDLAGNSLDGNKDGNSTGPTGDNYDWKFATGASLDLAPPILKEIDPYNTASSLPTDILIKANFNKGLDPDSVSRGATIYGKDYSGWVSAGLGQKSDNGTVSVDMTRLILNHAPFDLAEEGKAPPVYTPAISATVRDMRQNCFSPTKNDNPSTPCGAIATPGTSCCPNLTTFDPVLQKKAGQTTCERP